MTFPEVIDSSIMADFKACPAKAYLAYFQEWKHKGTNTHLHAGGAFARGLEVARRSFYEDKLEVDNSIALGMQALVQHYGSHQPSPVGSASNKTCERMLGALEFYFHQFPLNHQTAYPILLPGGKRGIEYSFVENLPILHPDTGMPLQYSGRADGIFFYAGGNYIFDDKTASQLGAQWAKQWKLRAQFSGYCWAARKNGIAVDGVVVRGLAIYKNGYGALEDISFRSEYMIDRWYNELLDRLEDMIRYYKTGRWPHADDHACSDYGGCGFLDICDQENILPWLERSHERKHWDPITRTETLLP